jgi:Glycosyl hydrolases family 16
MRSAALATILVSFLGCSSTPEAPPVSPPETGGGTSPGVGGGTAGAQSGGGPSVAGAATEGGASGAAPSGGMAGQGTAGSGAGGTSGGNQGGTASGGAAGGGAAGGGAAGTGSSSDPRFALKWRDDFDSFNDARWSKRSHTFEENLARFTPDNVVVEGGMLKLRVTRVAAQDREYSAAEVATKEAFTFGRFAGRIKFCAGSGMVSSLFTYKQDVSDSWQEIDIEHLGYLPTSVQYNLISGTAANRAYQPKVVGLEWSPTMEFHDYAIEWLPDGVSFFVDGVKTHHDVQSKLKDAQTLHMNAWPTNNAVTQFAGPFEPSAVPCEAQYDWVEVYAYAR